MNFDKRNRISRKFVLSLLFLVLSFSRASANPTEAVPLGTQLRNSSYSGFTVTDKAVTLKDGNWQGEPCEKGAAIRPEITLLTIAYPVADFNRDGSEEVAVLMTESGGAAAVPSIILPL